MTCPSRSTVRSALSALCLFGAVGCAATESHPVALALTESPAPVIVAHRGASAKFPENTLSSFRSALEQGAELVELDFVVSADQVLYCLHDKTLDRTTDVEQLLGRSEVGYAELEWSQLAALDAGSWKGPAFADVRLPTLADALDTIQAGAITMIERKGGSPEALVRLLRGKGLIDQVIVQAFDWAWLEAVHRLEPRIYLAALGGKELDDAKFRGIAATGARMVHWSHRDLTEADVERLHAAGYAVCVYTVNEPADFDAVRAKGIDAVTTDHPGRYVQLR